jgi:hypothetical protein
MAGQVGLQVAMRQAEVSRLTHRSRDEWILVKQENAHFRERSEYPFRVM